MKQKKMDVIVVGGGASGMMAAIAAAKQGCRVCILEHKEMPGKKILATGNGRCNFTNLVQGCDCYRGSAPAFVLPALEQFSAENTKAFFEELGILSTDRNGYCYPRTMQASCIRNALLLALKTNHISVFCDVGIRRIHKTSDGFRIETKTGDYLTKTCVLAAGGMAFPKSGSDGSGYIYAKQLGHTCVEPLPALVPLLADASWLKQTAGVRAEASVHLYVDGEDVDTDTGEVQFTDYGISGIPVFQISRHASRALSEDKCVEAVLDLLPEYSQAQAVDWLQAQIKRKNKTCGIKEILAGVVNEKLAQMISEAVKASGAVTAKDLARSLKCVRLPITGTKGFMQAQVTAGGIRTEEVCPETMESKLVNGLYFAGEILDIDGKCGGYNLQWAWSSGYCAGSHAGKAV